MTADLCSHAESVEAARRARHFELVRLARHRFRQFVGRLAPNVLRELEALGRDHPARVAALDLLARREDMRAAYPDMFPACFSAAERPKLERLDAEGETVEKLASELGVDLWAARWNLDAPWLRRAAITALDFWRREPSSSPSSRPRAAQACIDLLEDEHESDATRVWHGNDPWPDGVFMLRGYEAPDPGRPERHRIVVGNVSYAWESITTPKERELPPGWEPTLETREGARQRILRAFDEQADALMECVSTRPKPELNRNLGWLVRYQVRGESVAQIAGGLAPAELRGDHFTSSENLRATVRFGIQEAADLIGLPRRPGKPGRPRREK